MKTKFDMQVFLKKLKSMLRVDFKRMFTMPMIYIMAGVCFALPILILVMTGLGGAPAERESAGVFTNVWQTLGSVGGGTAMDLTGMCNINMLYFLVAVMVCVFVGEDFKSGYAKNLFTVRSKRIDYVVSKTVVTFVGAAMMFLTYFIGATVGGGIAGLSFSATGFGAGGITACLFSKIFMTAIFVGIGVLSGTVAKQKLWLSILGSFAAGMLLYTMIPMISPLNSTIFNVIMCLAGGAIFAGGLGVGSVAILNKTNLV